MYWMKLSLDIAGMPRFKMSGVTLGCENRSIHDNGLDL
jgi:hypothetical protein